jgi:hypothetical protein
MMISLHNQCYLAISDQLGQEVLDCFYFVSNVYVYLNWILSVMFPTSQCVYNE